MGMFWGVESFADTFPVAKVPTGFTLQAAYRQGPFGSLSGNGSTHLTVMLGAIDLSGTRAPSCGEGDPPALQHCFR